MNIEYRYEASPKRYDTMQYRRCGRSGVQLPIIALGLWQNFGHTVPYEQSKDIVFRAFDEGITHFDLANNYGPPYGSAEKTFGRIVTDHLAAYRDELIISSKAGYDMWQGPYGNWGSRKYLIASLDQSLKRMNLEYVDIFYTHRMDPETPLEETISALETIYKQGKALYVGISSYSAEKTREAEQMLRSRGIHCLIHQPKYSMVDRWVEDEGLLPALDELGIGCIAFSPLAQGLLSSKYLKGIPEDSRVKYSGTLEKSWLTKEVIEHLQALNNLAEKRGQSLAQMALAWVLRRKEVTSAVIGVSRMSQLEDCLKTIDRLDFTQDELDVIDKHSRVIEKIKNTDGT